jgi:hypothetical protein
LACRQSEAIGLSLADRYNMLTTDYQKQFGTFSNPFSALKYFTTVPTTPYAIRNTPTTNFSRL